MRTFLAVALTIGLLILPGRLAAQPGAQPGPEHEQFKQMEGTWDAAIKSQGGESKGVAIYKVGLGGLWLLEHFKADFGGTSFEGHGGTSYDANKKKYVGVWIDSMSTQPLVMEGTYDKTKKTMTMTGDMPTPDG